MPGKVILKFPVQSSERQECLALISLKRTKNGETIGGMTSKKQERGKRKKGG